MSLRDLTHDAHKAAETQPFVKILFSGNIDPKLYATFLKNQHPCYDILEAYAMLSGVLTGLPDIRRAGKINADFLELWKEEQEPVIVPAVKRYMDHIVSIKDDPKKLMAHVYRRHSQIHVLFQFLNMKLLKGLVQIKYLQIIFDCIHFEVYLIFLM